MIFPILSGIFSLIFMIAMLFPTIIVQLMADDFAANGDVAFELMEYLFIFLTYLGLAVISTFFNVCTVYIAKNRFEGQKATVGNALGFAFKKFHIILLWGLLSATVGLILYLIEEIARGLGDAGRVILSFLRSALAFVWGILVIFVVPSMVYYELTPFKAIKKSVETLKRTWGEHIVGRIGMGIIQFLVIVLAIILNVVLGIFVFVPLMGMLNGILLTIGLLVISVLIIVLFFNVAGKVYNTALFVYADTGKIPEGYSKKLLENSMKIDNQV